MVQKIAVINDLSGFGRCSLTAAIPVISVMGAQPCPLPTAILSAQTGFQDFYCDDYTNQLDLYLAHWEKMQVEFDGILTGYFANAQQIEIILQFISRFKKAHTKLFVDPIMGDGGEIYSTYTPALCDAVCSLALHADLITPNLTELCVLANESYARIVQIADDDRFFAEICSMAQRLLQKGVGAVIVTGLNRGKSIYNGVFEGTRHTFHRSNAHGGRFSGTGDLFAAAVCGAVMRGDDLDSAVQLAAEFIEKSVAATLPDAIHPNHGVNFEQYLPMLVKK